ncbi:cardiolipin synthase [uncultured Bacteroides sp.]|uniref:cardiolipin synthase n=1 Tax=uncultured Bacteroides sp. TaxID=162156 RepID=UPI0025D5FB4E|nr:cardiolipin synthase [uncultured Bacteroides sp.]
MLFIILFTSFIGSVRAQSGSDSLVMSYMQEMGIPLTYNNKIELLMTGREKFINLFEAIRHARHHIHLEYFNFRNDSIANTLFDLLAEKAKEGVEVRAMFDAFGNWSNNQPLKKRHLQAIKERGIEIVKFDPFTFPYINHAMHRDHRKIVVIDGKTGYTGGMNIADYYINGLPKIGKWHDIHMRIEGDAVRYLQGIFLTMWNRETGQHIGGPAYFPKLPQYPDSVSEEIAIVDRTPKETPRSISHAYAASIEAAQKNIQIVNPYFVPTKSIRKAIKKALKKGTKVEIMIPEVSDIPFTPEASFHIVHKLMKRGAKIYLFKGGFHHSKVMMVDSTFCTVGTANLNSRSLRYDYETNAFIFDPSTTNQLNGMFERDKQNSTLLTPEIWKQRSGWKKFVGWVGNLLTPFL